MWQTFLDTRQYYFWLVLVSLACLLLERLRPWRREQRVLRKGIAQDIGWLAFNGHYFSLLFGSWATYLMFGPLPALEERAASWNLVAAAPLAVQFAVYFLLQDFIEWCVHNALHRVPWLWEFHKLHHSIEELDWIGNFRFHWMEILFYKSAKWIPLLALGVDPRVILWIAIATTVIGDLNHSNLNISWGPLRFLINSPRMHVWHHAMELPREHPSGVNFGTSLSLWDWLFRTAHWPDEAVSPSQQPERLGFPGIENYPRGAVARFLYPLSLLAKKLWWESLTAKRKPPAGPPAP